MVFSAVVNIHSSGASIASEPTASRTNRATLPRRLSRWAPVRGLSVSAGVGGFIKVVAMASCLPQSMLKLLRRLRRNWMKVMTKTSTPRTIDIAVA